MNPEITLVGRLGTEPERIGTTGIRFRVVTSDRVKNDKGEWVDKDTSWWTVKMWNKAAEQTLATVKKGQEVIIRGTIYQDTWTDKTDGSTRSSYDVRGESIGVTSYSLAKNVPAMATTSTEDPWK